MSADPQTSKSPLRRGNRNWILVFAALTLLGALAVGINWVYNVGEPLTPERLKAAREQWARNRPADYDLEIEVLTSAASSNSGGMNKQHYDVQVRAGHVVSFLLDGREPEALFAPDGTRNKDEERRQRLNYDVSGLFDSIEEFMERDRREGIPSYMRARFDKTDGHLTLFKRQLNGKASPFIQVRMRTP